MASDGNRLNPLDWVNARPESSHYVRSVEKSCAPVRELERAIVADGAFYVLILAYAVVTLIAALILGDLKWFVPFVYLRNWIRGIGLFCCVVGGLCLWRARGCPDIIAAWATEIRRLATPRVLAGLALFSCIGVFYGTFTSAKMMMPEFVPFGWDQTLADIDEAIHWGDPWIYLEWLKPAGGMVRTLYGYVWFMILTGGTLLVAVTDSSFRRQYLWTFFCCWIVLGNVVPLMFMAGGPIYFEGLTGDPRFTGLSDRVFAQADINDPSTIYPEILWAAFIHKQPGMGTGISAFPSLHVSMATLFALAAFKLHRGLGFVMVLYLIFIIVGSVHLGWHYAIDGYFSVVATSLLWACFRGRKALPCHLVSSQPINSTGQR